MSDVTTVNGVDYSTEVIDDGVELDRAQLGADIYVKNTYKGVRHSMYLMDEVKAAFKAGYARGVDDVA